MFTTQQRIQIIVEAIDKATGRLAPVQRQIRSVQHGLSGLTEQIETQRRVGNQWVTTQRVMRTGLQRFKMEMLSVMFFGMGMYHMFMSWLRPAMESYGIFEMFGTMLEDLFLPIIEEIYPFLEGIMEWFMELPEPAKKVIGALVLMGAIFGGLLMILGMVTLGLSGLAMVGGKFVIAVTLVSAAITAVILLFSNWGSVIDWLKGVWSSFAEYLSNLWNNLLRIASNVFNGIFGHVAHAWTLTDTKTTSVWSRIKSFLVGIWESLLNTVRAISESIWNAIKQTWNAIWEYISGIAKHIYDTVVESFSGLIDWIFDWGVKFVSNMVAGLKATGSKIANTLWGLIPEPFRSAIRTGRKIVLDIVGVITGHWHKRVRTYQYGGVVPGRLGEPVPIIAHGGERFLGIRGGGYGFGGVIYFNPTYYVYVSDKAEFESMLKENNEKIVEELRRMIGG